MTPSQIAGKLFSFLLYTALQVLLLLHLTVFGYAFCFAYVAFLLMMPVNTGRVGLLFWGAALGLATGVFYDMAGVHMAACVLAVFLRGTILDYMEPATGYDAENMLTVRNMGLPWFATYCFLVLVPHHLAVFFLEAGSASLLLPALLKTVLSLAFTFTVIVLIQYVFYGQDKGKRMRY